MARWLLIKGRMEPKTYTKHPGERTMKKLVSLLIVTFLVLTSVSFVAAEEEAFSPAKVAAYHAIMKDPALKSLRDQINKDPQNSALMDNLLIRMSISPLDMFRIRMESKVREYIVPKETMALHQRWLGFHPEAAQGVGAVQAIAAAAMFDTDALVALAATVGTNRNTAATYTPAPAAYDGEIQLAVNKNNTNQMVAGANTWNSSCDTQSIVSSTDGGANWRYSCAPTGGQGSPNFGLACAANEIWLGSDPAVFWDNSNNVYFNYMLMCCNASCQAGNANPSVAMVAAKSTDSGLTWNAPAQGKGIIINHLGGTAFDDKQFYQIDNNPGSPYYGRHYSCWDTDNNNKFAYSSDGGQNWTNVDLPAGPTAQELGCEIAVSKNGTVHEVFNDLTCGATCTGEATYYIRSTNGGASWSTPVLVKSHLVYSNFGGTANKIQAANQRGINPFGAIDVDNSGGTYDGRLYVSYSDMASGSDMNLSDVYVAFSTDNGATWSSSNMKKVNDDGTSTPQFQPTVVVDQTNGAVVVGWQDGRNDTTNKRKIDVYASRSTDGGATWEANTKVTAASAEFTANTGISYTDENNTDNTGANPNNYGEYMGVDAHAGKGYFAFTDSRGYYPSTNAVGTAQKENIGFATVTFTAATPDFSISATSPVTINQGASGNSTITIGALSGFTGTVSFSTSGLPSGVTASYSPTTVTTSGTSTLTLTASPTATTGPATVTVTGTSGALTHNATINLTVNVVDTTNPTTSLTAPAAGTVSGNVTVSANASDNIGVTKVEFYAGASLIGTDTTSPYSITWNTLTVSNGNYTLTSKAYDAANNTATSAGVAVTVNNPIVTTPITNGDFELGNLTGWTSAGTTGVLTGTVHGGTYADRNGSTVATNGDSNIVQTFTVPSGGGTVSFWYKMTCPDTVTYDWVTATLKDNTTAVTTTLLGKTCATNASWVQVTSASLTSGHSYTLTLTSHDDNYAGDPSYTYFDDVVFTASVVDTTAPTTSITAPAAGSTVSGTVTINANATDTVGVTKVEFYYGATLISTDTTSPYSASWNTIGLANGGYTLTTKAYDAANNIGTSAGVGVTVNNVSIPDLTATYNTTYKTPACPAGGKSCDTGATLVNGRGTMTSGNELNRPNTINATCVDGNSGTYHSDESLDRVKIATNDGTALAQGKAVTVTFTAYCYSSTDKLDVYYTTNVATPSWVLVGTQSCTVAGVKAFTATYTLPSGSTTQAVRGNLRFSTTAGSCTTGGYDDRDDLVFGVN